MSTWKFLKRNRKSRPCTKDDNYPVGPGPRGHEMLRPVRINTYGDYDDLEIPGVLGVEETFPVPSLATRDSIDKLQQSPHPHSLEGKVVCFTGKMSQTRDVMVNLAYDYGMIPHGTVDDSVDLLVIADRVLIDNPSRRSSKRRRAETLGIATMSEHKFLSTIRDPNSPPIRRR